MDLDKLRSFILDSGVDIWTVIDTAISVASADHKDQLSVRRDAIVQKLYQPSFSKCEKCDGKEITRNITEIQDDNDDDQRKIRAIMLLLDDVSQQDERSLLALLRRLGEVKVTYQHLLATKLGIAVGKFKKHSSREVRKLAAVLVRKWKHDAVKWLRLNPRKDDKGPSEEEANGVNDPPKEANGVNVVGPRYSTLPKIRIKHNMRIESDKLGSIGKHLLNHEVKYAKKPRTARVKKPIVSNKEAGCSTNHVNCW